MQKLYDDDFDCCRITEGSTEKHAPAYRTQYRRDYGRLIHSSSFRRLQGKTQLFPNDENDFFRNRLTHSIEVAQIAKSIAYKINFEEKAFKNDPINVDLVEIAGLAHDIGHPPFGHNGEEALDKKMREHGGFEGNAQTIRILSKLEKKKTKNWPKPVENEVDIRCGLDLTARAMAAVLKYDRCIPQNTEGRKKANKSDKNINISSAIKGYYKCDKDVMDWIKVTVLRGKALEEGVKFKTIECCIMDIADDIAYSTYDLEDAFKAGFLNPLRMIRGDAQGYEDENKLFKIIAKNINDKLAIEYDISKEQDKISEHEILAILIETFEFITSKIDYDIDYGDPQELAIFRAKDVSRAAKKLASNGYLRTDFTSELVGDLIEGIEVDYNSNFPMLSKVKLKVDVFKKVEVLKQFTYQSQIMSTRLKLTEYRGKKIINDIFEALEESPNQLLPEDFRDLYESIDDTEKKRVICDFIAGMTDRYALAFYARLNGIGASSLFTPL